MKNAIMIVLGLIPLASSGVNAGVNGKYKVHGSENYYGGKYSFHGSVTVKDRQSGVFRIAYNDGDRADGSYKLNFETPLRETRKRQTVTCTWKESGITGTATLTFKGANGGYSVDFTYKATKASVRGSGRGSK